MTTIWPNGFAGGVDWRSWSDGLWQTASAGGLGPDASGEPEATDAEAPAVVITNAPPPTLETYAPPSGMPSDFFDGMDLAAYFSLIGYDPAAIEEMNANGSYRSEHDAYQANGGLQSQAEEAWRRSGQWASGDGWNDVNRELFLNNYMDSAYGIDPEAGTSLNDPRLARLAAEALNKAKKAGDLQGLEALKTALLQSGFGIREVPIGSSYDPDLNDATITVKYDTIFVLTPTGSSGTSQTGGIPYQSSRVDGLQTIGNTPYFSVPINNPALAQIGIESFEVSRNTVKHIHNRHFSDLPGQSQFAPDLKSETALVSYVIAPVLQNAYALDIRTSSKDSRGAIMINVYGNLPYTAGTDRNGAPTKSVMVSMRWVPGSQSAQVTTAFPVTQGRGN